MKINKTFICLLMALMLLFCVNAVSAEDTFNTELASNDAGEPIAIESVDEISANEPVDDALAADSGSNVLKATGKPNISIVLIMEQLKVELKTNHIKPLGQQLHLLMMGTFSLSKTVNIQPTTALKSPDLDIQPVLLVKVGEESLLNQLKVPIPL